MKLIGDAAGHEQIVEFLSAHIETKIIVGSAVEIDGQVRRLWAGFYNREGAFPFPVFGINGVPERTAQYSRDSGGLIFGALESGKFVNQGRAVRAHRAE